jgi:putative salt-induced outer membrane protein YdiY
VKHPLIHLLAIISCLAGSPGATAEDAETANTGSWNAANWATAKPGDIEADWVQTTSGEWLTGEIILIHDYELDFDSDEFDEVKIDMDDVQYIKSHWPQVLRFDGKRIAIGTIELTGDQIIVTNADGEKQVFQRNELVTMTSGGDAESNYWDISVTLGANIRKGNSDEINYNAKANLKRQTTESRFLFDYLGNFTTIDNERTVNNHRVNANFDIFITRHFFWQPVFGEYFRDRFQNIDSRILLGTGAGYYIIKSSKTEWDVSGGPAVQQTRFVTVQPGEENEKTTPSLSISSLFDTEVNSKVDFTHNYNIAIVEQDSGGYTHHMIATIETEITGSLDFDVSLVWDHIGKPTTRDDGTIPERNDTQILVGLKYEY